MIAEFQPMKRSEIAAIRAAAMTDSTHEEPYVRGVSVGILRVCDSHEHFRHALELLVVAVDERKAAVADKDTPEEIAQAWLVANAAFEAALAAAREALA